MSTDTLYYDGRCGLCVGTVRWLRRLDWLNRLAFVDMGEVSDEDLPVSRETADQGIPMRTAAGRIHVGFPAVRRALLHTPVGVLPGLLMYVPGIAALGRWTYRQIATRRHEISCLVGAGSDRP